MGALPPQELLAAPNMAAGDGPIDLLKARGSPHRRVWKRQLRRELCLNIFDHFFPNHLVHKQIDVEGAELGVLEGIGEGTWPRIRQVVVETHPVGGRPALVRELLERRGFRVTVDEDAVGNLAGGPGGGADVMIYAHRRHGG